MQIGAMQRLRCITDIVRHDTRGRDELQDISALKITDHSLPDLPDTKWKHAFLGTHALVGKPREIVLPLACSNVGRISNTAFQHGRTAVDVFNVDIGKVLDGFVSATAMDPCIVRNVRQRHKPVPSDTEFGSFGDRRVGEAYTRLVRFHKSAEVTGQLVARFPSDREVPDFAPILVVTQAPVANHFHIQ